MTHPIDLALLATSYTSAELLAIIAAVSALVITIGGVLGNLIITWNTSRKVDDNTKITTAVKETTAVTLGHVNSQTTKLVTENDALRNENNNLKAALADTKTTAAVLASNAAQQAQSTGVQEQLHSIAVDVAETKATLAKPTRAADARDRATDTEPKP